MLSTLTLQLPSGTVVTRGEKVCERKLPVHVAVALDMPSLMVSVPVPLEAFMVPVRVSMVRVLKFKVPGMLAPASETSPEHAAGARVNTPSLLVIGLGD